jgi:predicted transporter
VFALASLISAMNQVLSAKQISTYNASIGIVYGILSIGIGIFMLSKLKQYKLKRN